MRLEVDIEEVRLRLAALFGPLGVTRPFRPILRRIREATAEAGGGAELLARAYGIVDELELQGAERARPRPGAVELVDALAARGIPMSVFSERGRRAAQRG